MILNFINAVVFDWAAISIICGIILTLFMMVYYLMKIYDQFLVTRRRRKDDKALDELTKPKNQ